MRFIIMEEGSLAISLDKIVQLEILECGGSYQLLMKLDNNEKSQKIFETNEKEKMRRVYQEILRDMTDDTKGIIDVNDVSLRTMAER